MGRPISTSGAVTVTPKIAKNIRAKRNDMISGGMTRKSEISTSAQLYAGAIKTHDIRKAAFAKKFVKAD